MLGDRVRAFAVRFVGLSVVVLLVSGCDGGSQLARSGVVLDPPSSWRPVPATTWPVPGTPLAAWSGPEGSSLVVYRQAVPIADLASQASAEMVVTALGNRLANLPGLTETLRRTEIWGGQPAGRLEVVGPGVGSALAPSGTGTPVAPDGQTLVPTRRIVVGVPAEPTIFLVWHAPESSSKELELQVEEIRRGFRFKARPASTSSY